MLAVGDERSEKPTENGKKIMSHDSGDTCFDFFGRCITAYTKIGSDIA